MEPYVVNEPFDSGLLDVGDGHLVHWEAAGNRAGKPAVILHGGPGAALTSRARRMFDPERYLIVQFDQRQCGRSTPHASEPVVDLSTNTTAPLVADMEQLRRHIGVERWLLWGGSWGTTLALAYAQTHPERVTEMVLASVVGTSHADVEWVTRAMGRVFPRQWEQFRDAVPPSERDGDLAAAYARLLQDPDTSGAVVAGQGDTRRRARRHRRRRPRWRTVDVRRDRRDDRPVRPLIHYSSSARVRPSDGVANVDTGQVDEAGSS